MRTRRGRLLWAGGVAAVAVAAVVTTAIATNGHDNVRGTLEGYQEAPPVSTGATGTFAAQLANGGTAINYTLTYSGLEGAVTQSHIHFGQKGVSAGIAVWLCTGTVAPPAGITVPACPPGGGTVTGTIHASDVIGPAGQGIAPTELPELVRAIRAGVAYANVHSSKFPAGEIRAQLRRGKGDH